MGAILNYALQAFTLVKAAIGAGMALKDAYDLIAKYESNIQKMRDYNRGPSDAEWAELNSETEKLRASRPSIEGE